MPSGVGTDPSTQIVTSTHGLRGWAPSKAGHQQQSMRYVYQDSVRLVLPPKMKFKKVAKKF